MNAMRWVYLFIITFVLWVVISAMWYIWGVRGLTTEPATVNGHENALAVLEILLMLLGAFLIGYMVAYYHQEEPLSAFRNAHRKLDFESHQLMTDRQRLDSERIKLEQGIEALQKELVKALELRDKEYQILSGLAEEHKMKELELRTELEELQPKTAQLATEVAHLKFKLKQLEFKDQNTVELRVPKEDEIDDLTAIRGIGPVIARRLYAMGIYSFRQISRLDQNSIEQIGKILKYFPDRIHRDGWVSQAKQRMTQR